ncbi:hypothetical protein [Streptomyces neyagawaensis]|uniref:hypothetical protein n=1 Tax=Streptomyces neyagawaensis TaxID=42238 RepID=UPI0006E2F85C|nr:hypothetical protein [Streptomyces neyagawaensis]MCL6733314.1 hypothetical protein [Streptomyces neyagawaensis]MDE1685116.1 hypothetical protein [Streptomyces neyagawaensis]
MSGRDQEQPAPDRPRDWLDDYFQATATPTAHPSEDTPEPGPPVEEPEQARPWWSFARHASAPAQPAPGPVEVAPGVHITVNQPQPPPAAQGGPDRRARARRWLLIHGAAAWVGWTFGFHHSLAAFLDTLGPGGTAAGLAVAGGSWFAAEVITERYVILLPSRMRPPVVWALRIPFATALLTTALNTPNSLL